MRDLLEDVSDMSGMQNAEINALLTAVRQMAIAVQEIKNNTAAIPKIEKDLALLDQRHTTTYDQTQKLDLRIDTLEKEVAELPNPIWARIDELRRKMWFSHGALVIIGVVIGWAANIAGEVAAGYVSMRDQFITVQQEIKSLREQQDKNTQLAEVLKELKDAISSKGHNDSTP